MVAYLLYLCVTSQSDFVHGDASPGYFSLTLNNSIRMEATSTRRAGLERFTLPQDNTSFFALDLSNDLSNSFKGGNITINPDAGRITIGGFWGPRHASKYIPPPIPLDADDDEGSFGPGSFTYQAFACYDLDYNGTQKLDQFGIWTRGQYVRSILFGERNIIAAQKWRSHAELWPNAAQPSLQRLRWRG
jgi:hypothetical protein